MYQQRNGYRRLNEDLKGSFQASFFRDDREIYRQKRVKRVHPLVFRLFQGIYFC